jgi:hypothetical protein
MKAGAVGEQGEQKSGQGMTRDRIMGRLRISETESPEPWGVEESSHDGDLHLRDDEPG